MIWLLIGYMWLFIHRPFEIWTAWFPFPVERWYMIFTIICWLFSSPRLPARNWLHFAFGSFILVMLVSWLVSPYFDGGQGAVEIHLRFAVFYVLVVTTVRGEQDLRRIIVGYLAIMALWMRHSVREFFCGNTEWAQGFLHCSRWARVTTSTTSPVSSSVRLPFAWALRRLWTARWQRLLILGYCGLSAYCIVMTGSRMGFVGLLLSGLLLCLTSSRRWLLLTLFPAAFLVFWSVLPGAQRDRYSTLLGEDHDTKYSKAGDYRLAGLQASLPMFEERPLLGCGPMAFLTRNRFLPHNLYGQLLAELGIAGALAFASILGGVARNAVAGGRIARGLPQGDSPLPADTVTAVAAAYVLLAVMSWGFNFLYWHVWMWFGGFQLVALQCLKDQADMAASGEYEAGSGVQGVDGNG